MLNNNKLYLKNVEEIELRADKEYNLKQFINNYINKCFRLTLPNGIYGSNETRIETKCIEINGIIISNVDNLVIECFDEMLWFVCLDADNNILASRGIKRNERLVIKETAAKTYLYNFIKAVA